MESFLLRAYSLLLSRARFCSCCRTTSFMEKSLYQDGLLHPSAATADSASIQLHFSMSCAGATYIEMVIATCAFRYGMSGKRFALEGIGFQNPLVLRPSDDKAWRECFCSSPFWHAGYVDGTHHKHLPRAIGAQGPKAMPCRAQALLVVAAVYYSWSRGWFNMCCSALLHTWLLDNQVNPELCPGVDLYLQVQDTPAC